MNCAVTAESMGCSTTIFWDAFEPVKNLVRPFCSATQVTNPLSIEDVSNGNASWDANKDNFHQPSNKIQRQGDACVDSILEERRFTALGREVAIEPVHSTSFLLIDDLEVDSQLTSFWEEDARAISFSETGEVYSLKEMAELERMMSSTLRNGSSYATVEYLSQECATDPLLTKVSLESSSSFRKSWIKTEGGSDVYMLNTRFSFLIDAWQAFRHLNSLRV